MPVRLTREQLDRILKQARAEAPNECCGLLLGRGEVVEEVFPGHNLDQSPRTYLMDPQDQLRAERKMNERGWELLGIYHSHPHSKAYPSETDKAKALYSDARYVIISLADSEQPQIRAFWIAEKTDENGNLVKDEHGQIVKDVRDEDVVVI